MTIGEQNKINEQQPRPRRQPDEVYTLCFTLPAALAEQFLGRVALSPLGQDDAATQAIESWLLQAGSNNATVRRACLDAAFPGEVAA